MQAVPRWRSCGSLRRCRRWQSWSRRTCCGSAYSRPVRRILARAPLLLAASAAAAAAQSVRRTSLQGANGRRLSPGGGRERPREQLRAVRGEADGRPRRHACVRACVRACLGGVCVRAGRVMHPAAQARPAIRCERRPSSSARTSRAPILSPPPSLPPSLSLSLFCQYLDGYERALVKNTHRQPPPPRPPAPISHHESERRRWGLE